MVVLAKPATASLGVTRPVTTRAIIVSITVILTGIFSIKKEMTAQTRMIMVSVDGDILILLYVLSFFFFSKLAVETQKRLFKNN